MTANPGAVVTPKSDEPLPEVGVRIDLDRRINLAMHHNNVPAVKALHVDNRTDQRLGELEVRLSAEPGFAATWSCSIPELDAGATYNVAAVDLELNPDFLAELTERQSGVLSMEVACGDRVLCRRSEPVHLLPQDEWSGLSSLPEILAAFVLPDHPEIERMLACASGSLMEWTGDASFSGYRAKDPKRVYTTAAAVYAALARLELGSTPPGADFELEGQRIRLPDRILDTKLASCLDLALLAAACLEQAGLNALVVIVRGHAFTGVWLWGDGFAEPAIDDLLRLRKRVDLDEIAVFDPACATAPAALDFEHAVREARNRLSDSDDFLCAIDVRRARQAGIRPLPTDGNDAHHAGGGLPDWTGGAGEAGPAPDLSNLTADLRDGEEEKREEPEAPSTRLDRWRRKLLDLSLRNRLLNFQDTKKTIPLLCPDLAELEDRLAEGAAFHVLPRPDTLGAADSRDADAHRRRTGDEATEALLRDEEQAGRLRADLGSEELERRLTEIYRAARLGLEEGGASALYLAIGFLVWYESESSSQPRLAPLLLVPLDLQRKSMRAGFRLRLAEDDPRANVTLLEMLRQDHELEVPGLDPLPENESGLDVARILRTFRQAIRDIDRWDVIDVARVGLFSFTKFLMWRDLTDRAGELMKNAVVEHLVERPGEEFDPDAEFPQSDQLDDQRTPEETFCPLSADSSQLAAVFAAADGRSFVLEGPPGTGKSQTITNLIAHCLSQGKSVLFVSEKMAALNVVHRRLSSVGLRRFCLELHSNKAHKREVIAQIAEALERVDDAPADGWEREAARLRELRDRLNAYVRALHDRRHNGETVFRATSRLIGLREVPGVELRWPTPEEHDAEQLAELREVVARLATAGAAVDDVRGHAFAAVQRTAWTPGWQESAVAAIRGLEQRYRDLELRAREATERLALPPSGWSLDELEALDELATLLLDSPEPPAELLVRPGWAELRAAVASWTEHGRLRDALRAEMLVRFRPDLLELDLDGLARQLGRARSSWWPLSWWRTRSVRRALATVAVDGAAPPAPDLESVLANATELRDEEGVLRTASAEATALLGRHWRDGEADWDSIDQLCSWAERLRSVALRAARGELERAVELRRAWAELATEGAELLHETAPVGQKLVAVRAALRAAAEARLSVDAALELDGAAAWGAPEDDDVLGRSGATAQRWLENATRLRDWCAWRRTRADAIAGGLEPLVMAYEGGDVASSELARVFDRSYDQWWLAAITDREPVLSGFFSPEHERLIAQFRTVDDRYTELTRAFIIARLLAVVPSSAGALVPSSEMGILRREIGKKRRHMSVRRLLEKTPNLLPRLKPCLLMSPMSVAQFLDAGYPPFDIVVFDEASQIPVWDAVGAIARGRQAVIVGDPKQLPPTSFFQRFDDGEDEIVEDDVVEDLESILDDCLSARIPWLPLDWHYRSRHESLIAFSNYHYYQNRLLTFPSSDLDASGVSWRHVPDGVYDKGKSRTNRAEAEAVVAEITRRLGDPVLCQGSIGVVTFNQAQQKLVEDLLDRARLDQPELDAFFDAESPEPVFVKNLENVQGDERDVVLFSITYGPDAAGKVSMNFGPMNRDGGERRLNVAITRARREVLVFSTLQADQIDLARTRSRGVSDLKAFLDYAARGTVALAEARTLDPDADFDSPFEQAVHDVLVARGWQVHLQVGCSGFRIDLAVTDPAAAGRYLLGIECDGASYHRAKTARDRDRLREDVLRALGWRIHRIWSTDWWTDPAHEIEKLEAALAAATAAIPAVPEPPPAPLVQPEPQPEAESRPEPQPAAPPTYRATPVTERAGTTKTFYEPGDDAKIRAVIAAVVAGEGPLSLELAVKRVLAFWDFGRVSGAAVDRVRALIPHDAVSTHESPAGCYLWSSDMEPAAYDAFRVPGPGQDDVRDADDLPPEEVANGALHVLRQQISLPIEDLARETSRLFGFQRAGRIVQERMHAGIELLIERGHGRVQGASISLERQGP